jgi:drug/metabolite transporter (DMT)-like permease
VLGPFNGGDEMMISDQTRGFGSAILSAMVLATTGIFIRYLTVFHHMEPLVLAFWRNIFLVLMLFVILECAFPVLVEIKRADLLKMIGFGLVLALFNYLWTTSVAINGASVATFLVYSSVPFTALLGRLLLHESLGPVKFISVTIALGGCLLVSGPFSMEAATLNMVGIVTGLGSGICFAIYSLLGRAARNDGMNSWTIILYSFSFAALFLLSAKLISIGMSAGMNQSIASSFLSLGTSVSGWSALLVLAVGPTLIGFGLYTVSLGYLPSSVVNLIATTEPPVTAVLAFFLLGEYLSTSQIFGSGLILGAIVLLRLSDQCGQMGLKLQARLWGGSVPSSRRDARCTSG